jgi:hypothetical protein
MSTQRKLRAKNFTYPVPPPGSAREEDEWQHKATAVAIETVRKVIAEGAIPAGTPIGRLSETELGWLVAAALFGWIRVRAEQAVARGIDTELNIRNTGHDPSAWDAGTVAAILPKLAEIEGFDWSLPISAWPKHTMIRFLLAAMQLIRHAMSVRDLPDGRITRPSEIARQVNAAASGPLLDPDELEEPPF